MKNLHEIYVSLGKLLAEAVFSPEQLAGAVQTAEKLKKDKAEAEKAPKKADPVKKYHASGETFGGLLPKGETPSDRPPEGALSEPRVGRRAIGTHSVTEPYEQKHKFPMVAFPAPDSEFFMVYDLNRLTPEHITPFLDPEGKPARETTYAHAYAKGSTLGSGVVHGKGHKHAKEKRPTRALAGDPFKGTAEKGNAAHLPVYTLKPEAHEALISDVVHLSKVDAGAARLGYKLLKKSKDNPFKDYLAMAMVSPEKAVDAVIAGERLTAFETKGKAEQKPKRSIIFGNSPAAPAEQYSAGGNKNSATARALAQLEKYSKGLNTSNRQGALSAAALGGEEGRDEQLQGTGLMPGTGINLPADMQAYINKHREKFGYKS